MRVKFCKIKCTTWGQWHNRKQSWRWWKWSYWSYFRVTSLDRMCRHNSPMYVSIIFVFRFYEMFARYLSAPPLRQNNCSFSAAFPLQVPDRPGLCYFSITTGANQVGRDQLNCASLHYTVHTRAIKIHHWVLAPGFAAIKNVNCRGMMWRRQIRPIG